jgi:biotin carboxyl carrier protein
VTFEIDVNGRMRIVSVERVPRRPSDAGQRFRVTVDGHTHVVDAVRVNGGALSIVEVEAPVTQVGASHHVTVSQTAPGELTLAVADAFVRAVVNGRRSRRGAEASGPAGEQRISAPMPGKVLRVLVQPGDTVAARQPLVVVEAMKMENELSSPKAGRVKDVTAVEGQSVEAGRLLVVVE